MLDMMLIMINYRTRPSEEVFTHLPKKIPTSDTYVWLGQQSKTADWVQSPQTPNVSQGDLPTYGPFSFLQIELDWGVRRDQDEA